MRTLALSALVILAACSRGASEEKKYRAMEKSPLTEFNGERCRQAHRVADGYLEDGDQHKYNVWQVFAHADCKQST